jgi:hypothetical protein
MGRKHSKVNGRTGTRPQASKRSRNHDVGIDGISTDLLVRYAAVNDRDHAGWK